jgi:hypothetical protein
MILSFIFIIRRIIKYDIDFRDIFTSYTPILTAIAIILYAAFVLVLANLFNTLLQMHVDNSLSSNTVISIYCKSNLFKYLPGNIFHYIGRNQIAVKGGIPHGKVILATILETLLLALAASIVSIIFAGRYAIRWIIEDSGKEIIIISIFLTAAILGIILYKFNPGVRKWVESYVDKIKKIKFSKIAKFIAFYVGTFISNGIIFTFILSSLGEGLSEDFILPVVGIYAFSWIIGFITPGAPAGLGIREVMVCALLSGTVKDDTVLTTVVLYRFITILGDIIAFLMVSIVKGFKK